MSKIFTPSSWGKRAVANFHRARRRRLAEMDAWEGVPEKGTRWISVLHNLKAICDECDYEFLNQWNWTLNNYGYPVRRESIIKTAILMHRVIMGAPEGSEIDHANHDKLDNRRSNLRFCTTQQNQFNRLKTSGVATSKFKGVSLSKRDNRWMASIKIWGRTKNLGRFNSQQEAARAYDVAAVKQNGEFALINNV
jgi:hypothetical protein